MADVAEACMVSWTISCALPDQYWFIIVETLALARNVTQALSIPDEIKFIGKITGEDNWFRTNFTQNFVGAMRKQFPHRNVIVVHGPYNYSLVNVRALPYDLPLVADTYSYDILLFDSGTFVRLGDGGFTNWAFDGNFTRGNPNEAHVTFYPIGV
jgi:hypothetical protein